MLEKEKKKKIDVITILTMLILDVLGKMKYYFLFLTFKQNVQKKRNEKKKDWFYNNFGYVKFYYVRKNASTNFHF